MANKKRKLLTKADMNDGKPTSAIDALRKSPVGSGFFKPMAAYAGQKLFGSSKKKEQPEYTNIDGMKIAIRKNHRGRKASGSSEKD
tara:strand:- start:42 stop:299 length:258 start_codon:yes stop_codon:yes gene_type:complete